MSEAIIERHEGYSVGTIRTKGREPNVKLGSLYTLDPFRIQSKYTQKARKYYDDDDIAAFAESIKASGGIQVPLIINAVREEGRDDDTFYCVAGERRLRAARKANLDLVPCYIHKNLTDAEVRMIVLLENIARKDVEPFELALGVKAARDAGLTYEEIGQRVGKGEAWARKSVDILKLPEQVHHCFIGKDALPYTHATLLKELLGLQDALIKLAERAYAEKMPRSQLRIEIDDLLGRSSEEVLSGKLADINDLLRGSVFADVADVQVKHIGKNCVVSLVCDDDDASVDLLMDALWAGAGVDEDEEDNEDDDIEDDENEDDENEDDENEDDENEDDDIEDDEDEDDDIENDEDDDDIEDDEDDEDDEDGDDGDGDDGNGDVMDEDEDTKVLSSIGGVDSASGVSLSSDDVGSNAGDTGAGDVAGPRGAESEARGRFENEEFFEEEFNEVGAGIRTVLSEEILEIIEDAEVLLENGDIVDDDVAEGLYVAIQRAEAIVSKTKKHRDGGLISLVKWGMDDYKVLHDGSFTKLRKDFKDLVKVEEDLLEEVLLGVVKNPVGASETADATAEAGDDDDIVLSDDVVELVWSVIVKDKAGNSIDADVVQKMYLAYQRGKACVIQDVKVGDRYDSTILWGTNIFKVHHDGSFIDLRPEFAGVQAGQSRASDGSRSDGTSFDTATTAKVETEEEAKARKIAEEWKKEQEREAAWIAAGRPKKKPKKQTHYKAGFVYGTQTPCSVGY